MAGRKNTREYKKKYKGNRNNKLGILSIAAVVLMMCLLLTIQSYKLQVKAGEYRLREEELQTQLDNEKNRSEEIEELRDYVTTKKYIEEVAKDKLGLVYEDEIIFKSDN